MNPQGILRSQLLRFGVSVAAVLLATVAMVELSGRINSTTVALVFLLIILALATFFGRNPALLASFAAMLSFNYFFLPPVQTWHIADPQNLIAWAAFTITAIIAGELSAYAQRRRAEAEQLYEELQAAFEKEAQIEAVKQSEKLKSALLDAVTHDLRTPLTSIKASVTTLLESEGGHRTIELDDQGRAEFLHIIDEETDRLNRFIEGMVELARVEAGSAGSRAALSHVEEIINIAVSRAEKILGERHVRVNVERDMPLIRVDARAIAEVIYNLLENAAKYSPPDTPVTIAAASHGGCVLISVEDEGQGIPVDQRERVFDKFVRLDTETSDGLGLGLAIAGGIVEAQGGTIEIKDGNNGKGTKVVLTLRIGDE